MQEIAQCEDVFAFVERVNAGVDIGEEPEFGGVVLDPVAQLQSGERRAQLSSIDVASAARNASFCALMAPLAATMAVVLGAATFGSYCVSATLTPEPR